MIRGLLAMLVWGAFIFSLVNAAFAEGRTSSLVTDPENRSILLAWDRPAFEPGSYLNEGLRLSARSTRKGQKVDFLIDPKQGTFGPAMAQYASPVAPSDSSRSSFARTN